MQGAVMTIQKNMMLSSLLFAGTCAYSMESNIILTQPEADRIKREVANHLKRENGRFCPISSNVMTFIVDNKEVQSAFFDQKYPTIPSESAERRREIFNNIIDSYVPNNQQ
jgi:hypothetical protein